MTFSSRRFRPAWIARIVSGALLLLGPTLLFAQSDTGTVDVAPPPAAVEEEDTILQIKLPAGTVISAKDTGDLVRVGQSMEVPAGTTVQGDAVVIGGNLDVFGTVLGDAVVVGGTLTLHEGASIRGQAVAVFGTLVKIGDVEVRGEEVSVGAGFEKIFPWGYRRTAIHPVASIAKSFVRAIVGLVFFFFLILVFVDLFGKPTERIALQAQDDYFRSGLTGVLGMVLTPVTILVLIISLIGILLLPVLGILIGVGLLWGIVAVSLVTGRALGSKVFPTMRTARWHALVGLIALYMVRFVGKLLIGVGGPLHFLGWSVLIAGNVILVVAYLVGFGAVLCTRFGRRGSAPEEIGPEEPGEPIPPPAIEGAS